MTEVRYIMSARRMEAFTLTTEEAAVFDGVVARLAGESDRG